MRQVRRRIRTFGSLWPGKHGKRGIYGKLVKWVIAGKIGVRQVQRRIQTFGSLLPGKGGRLGKCDQLGKYGKRGKNENMINIRWFVAW